MRNDARYKRTLRQQVEDRLRKMTAFGESKRAAKLDGTAGEKIFSIQTYKTYLKHCQYYADWLEVAHPGTTIKKGRKYVNEWLTIRDNEEPELSAYTIQLEAKALGKLYQIQQDDEDYFHPRPRRRVDIKRSRGEAVRDKNFNPKHHEEIINFCSGTGLRRTELVNLKGNNALHKSQLLDSIKKLQSYPQNAATTKMIAALRDAMNTFPEEDYFVIVMRGKGGRPRISPIIGEHKEEIYQRIKNTPKNKSVWEYVSSNMDVHSYRGMYATNLYRQYARPIEEIPYDRINQGTGKKYQSEVYHCRGDMKAKNLDKKAMYKASKALGHNRIDVVASHYIHHI